MPVLFISAVIILAAVIIDWMVPQSEPHVDYAFDDNDLVTIDYYESLPYVSPEDCKLQTLVDGVWVDGFETKDVE